MGSWRASPASAVAVLADAALAPDGTTIALLVNPGIEHGHSPWRAVVFDSAATTMQPQWLASPPGTSFILASFDRVMGA